MSKLTLRFSLPFGGGVGLAFFLHFLVTKYAFAQVTGGEAVGIPALLAGFLVVFIIILVAFYIFSCFCIQKIAKKLDIANDWLAWVPLANLWLWVKVADKPDWWAIFLIVPLFTDALPKQLDFIDSIFSLAGFIVSVILLFEVPVRLHKPPYLALWNLLPLIGSIIYMYALAFG